ncbi:hypothetical protein D3C72_2088240 [compost metagenome]
MLAEGVFFPDANVVDQDIQIGRCPIRDLCYSRRWLGKVGIDPVQIDVRGKGQV